jgi:hypothetical protein
VAHIARTSRRSARRQRWPVRRSAAQASDANHRWCRAPHCLPGLGRTPMAVRRLAGVLQPPLGAAGSKYGLVTGRLRWIAGVGGRSGND